MGQTGKESWNRIGACAAFACAAFLLISLALVVNMFATANSDSGETTTALAYLWIGRLLALPIPLAIALAYFAMVRRHTVDWRTIVTAAPGFIVAAVAVWLGAPLAAMGEQMADIAGSPAPRDGAMAMGVAFAGGFVVMLLIGMTFAASIAAFGVARGLGQWPLILGLIAVFLGLLSLSPLGFGAVLALSAWWIAIGAGLWRSGGA